MLPKRGPNSNKDWYDEDKGIFGNEDMVCECGQNIHVHQDQCRCGAKKPFFFRGEVAFTPPELPRRGGETDEAYAVRVERTKEFNPEWWKS